MTNYGKVYKLLNAMYGLRDAGASFDRKVFDVMILRGASLGKFSICVECRKVMNTLARSVRWGHDFCLSGRRSLCNTFRDDCWKAQLGRDDSCVGTQCGDVRCAGSNSFEQIAEVVPSSVRGR